MPCQESDWQDHKAQCKSISAMRNKYKDGRLKEELKERLERFHIEEKARDEQAGPSSVTIN